MESRVSGSQIIQQALTYVDVTFRHRGRNRAGIDCAGLIICTLSDIQLMPDSYVEYRYSKTPVIGLVESTLDYFCDKTASTENGDIILMSFMHNPCHVGFYFDDKIIHAYEARGKVIIDDYDDKWRQRYVATYRVKQ